MRKAEFYLFSAALGMTVGCLIGLAADGGDQLVAYLICYAAGSGVTLIQDAITITKE